MLTTKSYTVMIEPNQRFSFLSITLVFEEKKERKKKII